MQDASAEEGRPHRLELGPVELVLALAALRQRHVLLVLDVVVVVRADLLVVFAHRVKEVVALVLRRQQSRAHDDTLGRVEHVNHR